MTTRSFLFELCDLHLCYAGCQQANSFVLVNSIFLWGWVVLLVLSLPFPCERIYSYVTTKKPLTQLFNVHMMMSICSIMAFASKIAFHSNLRSSYGNVLAMTDADIEDLVSENIKIELLYALFCFMGVFQYSDWIVQSFSGVNEDTWSIKISKPFHSIALCGIVLLCAGFSYFGVRSSLDTYILWRRSFYLTIVVLELVIEPVLLYTSGGVAIAKLLKQEENEEESKIKNIKKKILHIRSSMNGMFVNYVLTALVHLLIVVLNETLSGNDAGLLVSKCVIYSIQVLATLPAVTAYFIPGSYKLLGWKSTTSGTFDGAGANKSSKSDSKQRSHKVLNSRERPGSANMLQIHAEAQLESTVLVHSAKPNK
ncbi:hypothetical protein HDU91_006881 [Kappamyces sp. JEL0680]|nr:hypothetical protein HDU91_006881 [Kappamyces sp. JEL0680]